MRYQNEALIAGCSIGVKLIMDNYSKQRTRRVRQSELNWHTMAFEEVIEALDVKKSDGLADEVVRARLAEHGANCLAEQPPKPPWRLFLEQFKSLLILILIAAALLAGDIVLLDSGDRVPADRAVDRVAQAGG